MQHFRFLPLRAGALMMAVAFMAVAVIPDTAAAESARTSKTTTSKKKNGTRRNTKNQSLAARPAKASGAASAPKSSAEAKRLQDAARKEIQQTREKIRLNDQEIKQGLADLNRLSAEISSGRTRVADLRRKVSQLQSEIGTLGGNIAKGERELQRMRDEYLKAVKKMRLNQKNRSVLAFVFAADDFNQAMRRMRYVRQFSKWKQRKSDEINARIASLAAEKERLAEAKEAQSASLGHLAAVQADMETKHKRQSQIVEGLKQNGEALQTHLSKKQAEADRLRSTIANLIAQEQAKAEAERLERERVAREKAEAERIAREKAEAERLAREREEAERRLESEKTADNDRKAAEQRKKEEKKKEEQRKKEEKRKKKEAEKARKEKDKERGRKARNKSGRKGGGTSGQDKGAQTPGQSASKAGDSAVVKDFAALRGRLPLPVDGGWRVTNRFGRHAMPELPEVIYDNPGIDAEVAKGAAVKAVAAGKVSGVYKVAGYGTVVIVNHGQYYTVYGNLASVAVAVGTQVSVGQTVGSAAADPDDPGHGSVHFELWHGREKQNPESWLR